MNLSKKDFKQQYSKFRKQKRAILNFDERVEFIINSPFKVFYVKPQPFYSIKISLYKLGKLRPEYKLIRGVINCQF
jgi:hypothetical protein